MSEQLSIFAERVLATKLPLDSIIVVGSGVLDRLGIRRADDVDLVATEEVCAGVRTDDTYVPKDVPGDTIYYDQGGNVAVSLAWRTFPDGDNAYYDDLLPHTVLIDGIRYILPEYLLQWKRWADREKDQSDIPLIEMYLSTKEGGNI